MLRFKDWSLGELEMAVCNALWDGGEADVRALHERVGSARGITSNTVQSTAERLYRKGVLLRRKVSHAYLYSPAISRTQFAAGVLDGVASALGGSQPLLSAFVEHTGRVDSATLDQLEATLRTLRERSTPQD
jgi:predicted transcriptional regulator